MTQYLMTQYLSTIIELQSGTVEQRIETHNYMVTKDHTTTYTLFLKLKRYSQLLSGITV